MKTVKFLLMMMLLAASVCALASCDVLNKLPFDIPFLPKDTTASEVTTVPTTTTTAPDVTTTAPVTTTTAPVTTTAAPVTTTTASPIVQKTPADIPCFTFDGVLAGYTIGYESGAEAAASALAAAISLPSAAYDAATKQSIRLAIVPDGDVALDAGGYHIYMSGKTINILGGDAAGVLAGVNAFAATVSNGKTSHAQYLHTVKLGTLPADAETKADYLNRIELIGSSTENAVTAYKLGDEIVFVLNLYYGTTSSYVKPGSSVTSYLSSYEAVGCAKFVYKLEADDCTMKVEGTCSGESGIFAITVPTEMTLIPGSVRLTVDAFDSNNQKLRTIYSGAAGNENGVAQDRPNYTYIGGAIVEADAITSDVLKADDFESFWETMLTDNRASDPTSGVTRAGKATYRNGFAIYKMDADYLTALGYANHINNLQSYDYYEIYLRSDTDAKNGRPAVGYVTVPKNARAESLKITVGLNAYGTRDGYIAASGNAICVRMHPNGIPKAYYDATTNTWDTTKSNDYFKADSGFGKIVKDYDDPYNAYLADMLVRNIQMLYFLTDPEFSGEYPDEDYTNLTTDADFAAYEAMRAAYNGKIEFVYGGSMGGFQNVGTAALCTVKVKGELLVKGQVGSIVVGCPWMCDPVAVAGVTGRLMGLGTRIGQASADDKPLSELNVVGLSYLDTVHFGSMLPEGSSIEIQAGFGDTTCPSTGMIALWNAVTVEKKLIFSQNKDHSGKNPNVFNNADELAKTQVVITVPAQEN